MLREKCRTCGGTDLYNGRMMGQVNVMSPRSLFRQTSVTRCTVCVTCGGIEPYLDDAAIARVKAWKAGESHLVSDPGVPAPEGRQQSIMILLMVIAALIGLAAAILVPILQTAQKIK